MLLRHLKARQSVPSVIALSALRGSCQIRDVGHAETCSTEAACTVGSRVATRVAVRCVAMRLIMHSNVLSPGLAENADHNSAGMNVARRLFHQ